MFRRPIYAYRPSVILKYRCDHEKAKDRLSPFQYQILSKHIFSFRNCMILGAGASYGATPLWTHIRDRIIKFIDKEWMDYGYEDSSNLQGFKRLIFDDIFRKELAKSDFNLPINQYLIEKAIKVPYEVLVLLYKLLLLEGLKWYCHNPDFNPYNVIASVHPTIPIINYNQDGLLHLSSNQHKRLVEPHGSIKNDIPQIFSLIIERLAHSDSELLGYELAQVANTITSVQDNLLKVLKNSYNHLWQCRDKIEEPYKKLQAIGDLLREERMYDDDVNYAVEFEGNCFFRTRYILPKENELYSPFSEAMLKARHLEMFITLLLRFRSSIPRNEVGEYFIYIQKKVIDEIGIDDFYTIRYIALHDEYFEGWFNIIKSLKCCETVNSIGFSFADYDYTIIQLLREYCSNKTIYIFTPYPRDIAIKLSHQLKNQRIIPIPLDWNEYTRRLINQQIVKPHLSIASL